MRVSAAWMLGSDGEEGSSIFPSLLFDLLQEDAFPLSAPMDARLPPLAMLAGIGSSMGSVVARILPTCESSSLAGTVKDTAQQQLLLPDVGTKVRCVMTV